MGALMREMRKMSAYSVLFSHLIAEQVGIHSTDLEATDMLSWTGPITAGRLADLTGLTTGAVTALIDRLEAAGFVQRERDPNDKRRVIIQPIAERADDVAPLYEPIVREMIDLCAQYNERDLALILDFATRAATVSIEMIAALRASATAAKKEK